LLTPQHFKFNLALFARAEPEKIVGRVKGAFDALNVKLGVERRMRAGIFYARSEAAAVAAEFFDRFEFQRKRCY
jgi:hypothetical protein